MQVTKLKSYFPAESLPDATAASEAFRLLAEDGLAVSVVEDCIFGCIHLILFKNQNQTLELSSAQIQEIETSCEDIVAGRFVEQSDLDNEIAAWLKGR